jgi:hypothetical protein
MEPLMTDHRKMMERTAREIEERDGDERKD